jgi:hypothetical protein
MSAEEFRQLTYTAIAENQARIKAHYEPIFNQLRDQCRAEAQAGRWFKEFDGALDDTLIVMFRSAGFDVELYNPTAVHCKDCDERKGLALPLCPIHLIGMKAKVCWERKSYD